MTVIAQLSDTHFGTELPDVVAAVKVAVARVKPDIILLTGDITQRARKVQFEAAADFMSSLPASTRIVIPGNHDIPLFNPFARMLTPYRHFKRAFGARETIWNQSDIAIIGFDATHPLRHTRGRLEEKPLLARIAQAKQQMKHGALLFACIHQPLVTAWPQDASEVLIHAEQTAKLLAEQGVDMVLSGHVHVPLSTTTEGIFSSVSRHFILAGAGTSISRRTRPGAPNSFNVIRLDPGRPERKLTLSQQVYDETQKHFVQRFSTLFRLGTHGWHML